MAVERARVTKQLAEVTRNRLGRFARVEYLRTCDPIAGRAVLHRERRIASNDTPRPIGRAPRGAQC